MTPAMVLAVFGSRLLAIMAAIAVSVMVYGFVVFRRIARDDKEIAAREQQREKERLRNKRERENEYRRRRAIADEMDRKYLEAQKKLYETMFATSNTKGRSRMKHRKKPVVIEAFQYDGDLKSWDGEYDVPDWAVAAFEEGVMFYDAQEPWELYIHTLEGIHRVNEGDYIIRGVKSELYPCKPDIFELTYEGVDGE